jgi:uncharacterized protein (TIGR03067 family)
MRSRSLPLGIAALTLGLLAASADDKDKKDADGIKGSWQLTAMTVDGRDASEAEAKAYKIKFQEKSYVQLINDESVEEGTYKLDSEKSPKTIDFIIEKGQDKGKTQLGIYELDGDMLKFCVTNSGSPDRPKGFDAKTGSNQMIFAWKRIKD